MEIGFSSNLSVKDVIVVGVHEGEKLSGRSAQLNRDAGGLIAEALGKDKFIGKLGESLTIFTPRRVILLGLGKEKELE